MLNEKIYNLIRKGGMHTNCFLSWKQENLIIPSFLARIMVEQYFAFFEDIFSDTEQWFTGTDLQKGWYSFKASGMVKIECWGKRLMFIV